MTQEISSNLQMGRASWRGPSRVAAELFALATVAWIAQILMEPNPAAGVNVQAFDAKWIVYTYLSAAMGILVPAAVLLVLCALICLVRWRRPTSYWKAYRMGSIVLVIWAALMTFGLWYGG
jgi:hypothetical protein